MITPSFSPTATERVLPKLALDFTTASLDPRVTFTRTTSSSNPATYVNSSGVVTAATDNQPRFDYDPVTLTCKGLLIEESRTNLVLNSQDLSAASWVPEFVSVSTDQTTSPDGTSNADLVSETADTSYHTIYSSLFTTTSANAYAASVFLKKGSGATAPDYVTLYLTTGASGFGTQRASVNVSNGTVGQSLNCTVTSQSYGNGWYRFSVVPANTAGSTSARMFIAFNNNSATPSTNLPSYQGATTSNVFVWGTQTEKGAFATSYIPTDNTAGGLTRNADVATMTGTNLTDWLNVSQGTFVAVGDCYRNSGANVLCALSAGSSYGGGNGLFLRTNGNLGQIGGNSTSTNSPYTRLPNVNFNICGTYNGVNATSSVNGAYNSTISTLDFTGVGTTTFVLGALTTGGSQILNGHINKIYYYPQSFTTAQTLAYSRFGV